MNEFAKAAIRRIEKFAKSTKEEIGPLTKTAIITELKTMFEAGERKERIRIREYLK